ncbi:MAG TPA: DUF1844 domain-containing protein [Clostridia bacterium]|nr:DUF1844 domain-containing protein [Clostridia bacterium]
MPKNDKNSEFVVTDRRKFTLEGELKPGSEISEEPEQTAAPEPPIAPEPPKSEPPAAPPEGELAEGPSAEERDAQLSRYTERTRSLDQHLQMELNARGGGRNVQDFEMTFEKFVASIYMTALMQLGLVQEQGMQEQGMPPRADLIGARQTIDTLAIMAEKTKGNLTSREDIMLQNCLYELRMAYLEITSAITRPPQAPMPPDPLAGFKK